MEGGGRSCPALGGHFLRCCEQRLCGPPRPGAALLPAPGHRSLLTPTSPYLRARGHAMPPDQTLLRTFPGLRSAANPAGARATQAASAGPRPAAAPLPEPASPHARGLHPAQNSTQNLGAGRDGDYWRGKKERERTWSPPQASRPLGRRRPAATAKRFQILAGGWVAGVQHNRGRDYRARLSRPLEPRLALNAVAMATRRATSVTASHIRGGGNSALRGAVVMPGAETSPLSYSPTLREMVTPSRSVAVVTV